MTPAQIAIHLQALDWSATSLQHQLAVAAAISTLGGPPPRKSNIIPFPAPSRPTQVTLTRLDGSPFAQKRFTPHGPEDAWSWVQEVVANETGCAPDEVGCAEGQDGADLLTVQGFPAFLCRITARRILVDGRPATIVDTWTDHETRETGYDFRFDGEEEGGKVHWIRTSSARLGGFI